MLCLAKVRSANLGQFRHWPKVLQTGNVQKYKNTGRDTPLEDWIGAKDVCWHDDIAYYDLCYVLNEGRLIEVQSMTGPWYGGTEVQGCLGETTYRSSELIVWRVDGFVVKNLICFVWLWRQKRAEAIQQRFVVDMLSTVSDNVA